LGVVGKIIAEKGLEDVTKQVARSLGVVGIVAYNRMVAAKTDVATSGIRGSPYPCA